MHGSAGGARGAGGRTHSTRHRPGEQVPTQTIPIAVKYAVVTAVLLVVFLIFVARSDLRLSLSSVDREINQTGILAAMFASETDPFWADNRPSSEKAEAQTKLAAQLRARIEDPAAAEVLDIIIFGPRGETFIERAGAGNKINLENLQPLQSEEGTRAGVEIQTGFLSTAGSKRRVRFFERPIQFEGRVVGFVQVFLSADRIDDLERKLSSSVIRNVLIALVIGIPVVLFVGRVLTGPIRELKRDMERVAQGDLDHQSAVRSHDELGSLAAAFNRMTHQLSDAQAQELRRLSLERDLAIATRIQSALLPETLPAIDGYQIAAYYASAKEVGGDYYDFIPLEGDRLGIVVADVSGKGIPGSLVMTMTRSLVRMAAHAHNRVSDLLSVVNESLSRDMTRGMFVTLIYFDFDPASGRLEVGRAGHNPAYLYQAAKGSIGQIQPSGIALGMDPGPLFSQALQIGKFHLEIGDFLVLYTDGVIEAMDVDGNEYTPERFVAVLEAVQEHDAETIVQTVIADLADHTRGAEPSDDVTLLIVKRT